MKNKRVLVIGDIILDHYVNVNPSKISSEAPLVIYNYVNDYYSLGGSGNVCKYLSSFSLKVDLFGVVGKDTYSDKVYELLNDNNINANYVFKINNYKTVVKKRYSSLDYKQIMRVDFEDGYVDVEEKVLKELKKIDTKYDLIIISDYRKGVITNKTFEYITSYARKNNIKVICDPKDKKVNYNNIYLLKPNLKEMTDLICKVNDENIIKYKNDNKIDNIVLTLGKEGIKLYDSNNNITSISAYQCNVFDVTGAGDCVLSYLAYGILNDYDMVKTCNYSNYAASLKVSRYGTALVNKYEVLSFFNNKIIDRDELVDFSNFLHKDKKIVFTNGCFDILHSGHIHLLKNAKMLGDALILGLNTDSSIKRLKGNDRPINNEKERVEILSSLAYVDYIVLFDEDTPLNIIKMINPDILVKGSDYKNKEVVGSDIVLKNGGRVELIDLIEGKSTTNIINRLKETNNE